MTEITITMPLPPKCLRGNAKPPCSRRGAIGLSKAKQKVRGDAYKLAMAAIGRARVPRWSRATVSLRWYAQRSSWLPDEDNAVRSVKHHIDGLADAGVVTNDRDICGWEVVREVDGTRPRVEITVRAKE